MGSSKAILALRRTGLSNMGAATFIAITAQTGGIGRMIAQIKDPDDEFLACWILRWKPGSDKWTKFAGLRLPWR
jgi:hypothetical protein